MTWRRALLRGAGLAAAAAVVALLVVAARLDHVVKDVIEQRGTALTGTAVRVEAVDIALTAGRATVRGLTVANPPGFTTPNAVSMESVEVGVDLRSLLSGPLVIDAVRVVAPHVFYEVDATGTANIDVIRRHVEASRRPPGPADAAATPSQRPPRRGGEGRRLVIHLLELREGEVTVAGKGGQRTEDLPPFELTAIGLREGGVSPAEAGRIILVAVARDVAVAVAADELEKAVGKHLGGLLGDVVKKGGAGAIGKGLGGVLDQILGGGKNDPDAR